MIEPTETGKSVGERNFEQFAQRYASAVETKPHNAYYERPATLSLLPDVAGKRVLDAGCGPGIYSEWLIAHGAEVVAIDVTPEFVEIAQERIGDRARVLRANLEQRLDFARDESFDIVLCALVLDHIRDWGATFVEFCRVLKPGGMLVFSAGHPVGDWLYARRLKQGQCYFDVGEITAAWKGFGEPYPVVTSYRRPLGEMLNPLVAAGFALDRLLEPLPTDEYRKADPKDYARFMIEPGFLCVRAIKAIGAHQPA